MKYIVTINEKNYEVEVEAGKASVVKTTQAAVTFAPSAVQEASSAKPTAAPQPSDQAAVNGEPIKAPMPGVILALKVGPGIPVKRGDVLFILEAMKMENEITASRDGVVTQIAVAKGASVSTGDILAALQ